MFLAYSVMDIHNYYIAIASLLMCTCSNEGLHKI